MMESLSPNTQAILLLTAPLIVGRGQPSSELLTPGEYRRLARSLRDAQCQPADLLGPRSAEVLAKCRADLDAARLESLLGRGFLLGQAIERWGARAIWVVSRADASYPKRIKARLKEDSPPILYGCGDEAILERGGLAIVGSRHVDDALIAYTEGIGRLAALAGRTVVSGGARGIDQAAMRGALQAGGSVTGVLADSLERAALARGHREALLEKKLALVSPYDPASGFNVGHAMQRNKLIYALADAALVVSSDYEKGGTWTGAVEQLERLRYVPVYTRSDGEPERGLEGLRRKGARPWPDPSTPGLFEELLTIAPPRYSDAPKQAELSLVVREAGESAAGEPPEPPQNEPAPSPPQERPGATPAEELFDKVRQLLGRMKSSRSEADIAAELQVTRAQAKEWLQRLVQEGVLEKLSKPVRYRSAQSSGRLL